jgi:diguanylate cyclase
VNQAQVLYLMTGLLFGTTLLAIGMTLGYWMAKRSGGSRTLDGGSAKFDPREFLSMVRSIADWTSDIAGDVSKYQSQMHQLAELAREHNGKNAEELRPILDQILVANNQLQSRLEAAERKLEDQTGQLEGYLTEARTDALTGLPNRRAFDHSMDELYSKHLRTQQPLSLVLIDVDHFKKINDTYGHSSGDIVLMSVAKHLAAFAKECHLVARYGGEEFGLIFSAPRQQAAAIAERIRASVAASPVEAEGKSIQVTMSAGVAQLESCERLGELFRNSDQALYSAKESGRNRVVVFEGQGTSAHAAPGFMKTETPAHVLNASKQVRSAATEHSGEVSEADEVEKRVLAHLDRLVHEESHR